MLNLFVLVDTTAVAPISKTVTIGNLGNLKLLSMLSFNETGFTSYTFSGNANLENVPTTVLVYKLSELFHPVDLLFNYDVSYGGAMSGSFCAPSGIYNVAILSYTVVTAKVTSSKQPCNQTEQAIGNFVFFLYF